jgi:deoxyribodipyrimidine photo-lyase
MERAGKRNKQGPSAPSEAPITLVWLRRDLRLNDNPALHAAVQDGPVLPIYLYTPDEERPWAPGAASRWYLHRSLSALRSALGRCGLGLTLARGDSVKQLLEQTRRIGASRVFWNRVYEPALVARDARVKAALERAGIEVRIFHDCSLLPPGAVVSRSGAPYRVFTPFWKQLATQLRDSDLAQRLRGPLPALQRGPWLDVTTATGSVDELGLLDEHPWHTKLHAYWQPGEELAAERLRDMTRRLGDYPALRDVPSAEATSGLSAALHFGEVSALRVLASCLPAWSGEQGSAAAEGADGLIRQLAWREFAIDLLHQHPDSAEHSLRPGFDDSGLWADHPDLLQAWQQGRTGFALVDAGMRQLWQTGWMHNRVRMVAASMLTKNLGIHWRHGARWFWNTLVDADLASNSMGWQWVAGSGCDAAPYYRIFNPDTQATRYDAEGHYVRRWLKDEGTNPPLVGLASSRKAALERYRHRNLP